MRRVLLAGLLVLAVSSLSNAAPCTPATLSTYVALGAGGCTIGAHTVSNVGATALLPPEDADAIDPDSVMVTPVSGVGLDFGLNAVAAARQLDLLLRFALTGPPRSSTRLALSDTSASGDGNVSAIQDTCVGGSFQSLDPTSPCSGTASTLIALQTATDVVSPVFDAFAAASFFDVFIEVTLDPGLAGSASAGTVSTRFGTGSVPEPSLLALLAVSLVAVRRRRLRA